MTNEGTPLITVLTPTYNRAARLPALYESLLKQTAGGFDWLIVDDGSADGTKALVGGWIAENKLPIRYVWRENGGKHRALNTGIKLISAPLTFIVDSDDTLLPDAIREITALDERHRMDQSLCGYSFLRVDDSGASLAAKGVREGETIASFADMRLKRNNPGDMAEVWRTKALRETPFPEFSGERFYSETGVWLRISGPQKLVFVNTPIYRCNYYADGLTKNRQKAQRGSPRGVMDCDVQLMKRACGLRANIKGALRYDVFAHILRLPFSKMLKDSGRPLLVLICLPLSLPLRRRWTAEK